MIADIKIPLRNEFLVIPGRVRYKAIFSSTLFILREFAAEVLFAEDGDIQSLPQLILDCVLRVRFVFSPSIDTLFLQCPVDLRRKMLESLVVIGGLAQLNGLLSRLKDELKDHLENSYKEKLHGKTVRFYRYKETQLELYASWLGGKCFIV